MKNKRTRKARKGPRKGKLLLLTILMKTTKERSLSVPRCVQTYLRSMYLFQGTGQAKKWNMSKYFDKEKRFAKPEVNVIMKKQVKKALKQKNRKCVLC